jgi:hypothetical protein
MKQQRYVRIFETNEDKEAFQTELNEMSPQEIEDNLTITSSQAKALIAAKFEQDLFKVLDSLETYDINKMQMKMKNTAILKKYLGKFTKKNKGKPGESEQEFKK